MRVNKQRIDSSTHSFLNSLLVGVDAADIHTQQLSDLVRITACNHMAQDGELHLRQRIPFGERQMPPDEHLPDLLIGNIQSVIVVNDGGNRRMLLRQ